MSHQMTSHIAIEDFILFKVRGKFSNFVLAPNNPIVHLESSNNTVQEIRTETRRRPPTADLRALRRLGAEYERRYENSFPDLMQKIKTTKVAPENVDQTLNKLSQMLFQLPLKPAVPDNEVITEDVASLSYEDDHIQWGHIVGFMVISSCLAIRAVEDGNPQEVAMIIKYVSNLFDTVLSGWFDKNGGWDALLQYSRQNMNVNHNYEDLDDAENVSVRSFMSVGVLAACVGFGAMIMARK